jgi:FKBP-type peptidyl-prolyl cis-trans isomerase FkpA
MFKKFAFATVSVVALVAMQACQRGGGKETTPAGLEYEFHTRNTGDTLTPNYGDVITMHFVLKNSADSVLRNTWEEGEPVQMPLSEPSFRGAPEEGFRMMHIGDSATFWVPADSLFQGQNPPFIAEGSKLQFNVKMINIQSMEAASREFEEQMRAQQESAMADEARYVAIDDSLIADYARKNNLQTRKTESGLQYVVEKPGTGKQAGVGDSVTVNYTLRLLDGRQVDSSMEPNREPLTFPLGQGMVIPGWDEGIGLFREGGKGKLLVPSRLGYRSQGAGGVIPPNAVLVFDVELLKVRKR